MTVVTPRGERFVLRVPTSEDERRKLAWIAAHYPVEPVRKAGDLAARCCSLYRHAGWKSVRSRSPPTLLSLQAGYVWEA